MVKSKVLKQLRKKVEKANRLQNPLDGIDKDEQLIIVKAKDNGNVQNEENHGENVVNVFANDDDRNSTLWIDYHPGAGMKKENMKFCIDLFQRNMADLYKNSSWGLDMEEKAEELKHRNARFLLVKKGKSGENNETHEGVSENGDLAAFVHFRFDYDDDEDPASVVLYVYEIQVHARFQRLGLGHRLMSLLESVANKTNMEKVMLTVFKKNVSAMNFYRKSLNYGIDENSPSVHGDSTADYEILSKPINGK